MARAKRKPALYEMLKRSQRQLTKPEAVKMVETFRERWPELSASWSGMEAKLKANVMNNEAFIPKKLTKREQELQEAQSLGYRQGKYEAECAFRVEKEKLTKAMDTQLQRNERYCARTDALKALSQLVTGIAQSIVETGG